MQSISIALSALISREQYRLKGWKLSCQICQTDYETQSSIVSFRPSATDYYWWCFFILCGLTRACT